MKSSTQIVRFLIVFYLAIAVDVAVAFRITNFVPQGDASDVRQVRAIFSEDIVPAGDPRRPAPFTWDCSVNGESVWVDARTWTLNFVEPIPMGTKCEFKVKDGLKAQSGRSHQGSSTFGLTAGGFKIVSPRPWSDSEIEENQIFGFLFNARVDQQTIADNVFIEMKGVRNRIPLKLIGGKARDRIINSFFGENYRNYPDVLILKPSLTLPSGEKVSLVFSKGLRSANGAVLQDDIVFPYTVRKPFTVSATCVRENSDRRCNPFGRISLWFSATVSTKDLSKIKITKKSGEQVKIELSQYVIANGEFSGFDLPGQLIPNEEYKIDVASDLVDVSGRKLSNASAFPISMAVDEYPPLAKFATDFGVLEYDEATAVPVTARNLETDVPVKVASIMARDDSYTGAIKSYFKKIIGRSPDYSEAYLKTIDYYEKIVDNKYNRVRHTKPTIDPKETFAKISNVKLPKLLPPRTMEIVGIPVKEPGFHVYEITSSALGSSLLSPSEGQSMYVPAAYMVTDLAVHLKLGKENSLVWVTELRSGKPAKGANVTVVSCSKKVVWTGRTNESGAAEYKGDLGSLAGSCNSHGEGRLYESDEYNGGFKLQRSPFFVFAQLKNDFSFTKSDWNAGIEYWRWPMDQPWAGAYPLVAHSMLDRSLLRAGETVHFKHFVRQVGNAGYQLVDSKKYDKLQIQHLGSDDKFDVPIKWSTNGSGDSSWDIPKSAKLGFYRAKLIGKNSSPIDVASFNVQEFRVPLTKAFIKVPADELIGSGKLDLKMGIHYLSGGGVGGTKASLVSHYSEYVHHLNTKKYQNFGFNFGNVRSDMSYDAVKQSEFETVPLKTDEKGQLSYSIPVEIGDKARTYRFELNYTDPNGEIRTYSASKEVIPNTWNIGVDTSKWLLKTNQIDVNTVLLDEHANPLSGKNINVRFLKREYLSHRKKVAGGVYKYENKVEIKDLNIQCAGLSDSNGRFSCSKTIPTSGAIFAEVSATNKTGAKITTNHEYFVSTGKDRDTWFGSNTDDRMDLLADKKEYEPGDTASIQVQSPFKEYWALITTEREGVLGYDVKQLKSSSPIVDVKITGTHAPNVFVSVLGVRGRIDGEKPTAFVDLSKPAFKLGKINLKVGWKENRLNVEVKPEKNVYTVRSKAKVKVKVSAADGVALSGQTELAVAVVDEGLLELQRNLTWRVLEAMLAQRPLAVETFTSQMHVIGKRHFGQKAMNLGGDGGLGSASNPRELFETLLSWQPHVPVDQNGEATFEFVLNDSLTSFSIAVVATSGAGKFGTGTATVRSTKDVILFAGMPPVVRGDDVFEVKLTARNTLNSPISFALKSTVKDVPSINLDEKVSLNPNETKVLTLNFTGKIAAGAYKLETTATLDNKVADSLISKFTVIPNVVPRVQQGNLLQLTNDFKTSYEAPKDAVLGVGGLKVSAQRTLIGSLDGIKEFARTYPYSCYEQQLSKIFMLDDEVGFKNLAGGTKKYLDENGLVKYFPSMISGSVPLTAYVLQASHSRGWKFGDDVTNAMVQGLQSFLRGNVGREARARDHIYARLAVLDALSRYVEIAPDALEFIPKDIASWPTSAVIDLLGISQRGKKITNASGLRELAENALQSRISLHGTTMGFRAEERDFQSYMMTNPDVNAFRTILSAIEFKVWQDQWGKYMAGAVGRLKRGAAITTTGNAWGSIAARRFSEIVESKQITGKTEMVFGGETRSLSWKNGDTAGSMEWPWINGPQVFSARHVGGGTPWVSIQSYAAIDRKEPFYNGVRVSKSVEGVQGSNPASLKVGDLVRVIVKVTTQSMIDWLVILDPVPSGVSVLGKGIGGESDAQYAHSNGAFVYPTFVENAFDSVRAYYERVDDGTFTFSYTVRINNAGTFTLPVTHVEALYAPDVFAEIPNAPWTIRH